MRSTGSSVPRPSSATEADAASALPLLFVSQRCEAASRPVAALPGLRAPQAAQPPAAAPAGDAIEERGPAGPGDRRDQPGGDEVAGVAVAPAAGVGEREAGVAGERGQRRPVLEARLPVVALGRGALGAGAPAGAELVVQEREQAVRAVVLAIGVQVVRARDDLAGADVEQRVLAELGVEAEGAPPRPALARDPLEAERLGIAVGVEQQVPRLRRERWVPRLRREQGPGG